MATSRILRGIQLMTSPNQIHPTAWSVRLAFELSANDLTARALIAGLNEAQLNWQPSPGAWSVGQCLEHLCLTNEAYMPVILAALRGKPDMPAEEMTPGKIERWFVRKFVEPSPNGKRAPAPHKIRPTAHVNLSVLDRFLFCNKACRELFIEARMKNVNRIRFWNPLVPGIRFTVGTGFEIIASHERRHLLQGERVRDLESFPGKSVPGTMKS